MNELFDLLDQFNQTIKEQIESFKQFLVILDDEESAISNYNFGKIERSVIQKDQHVQIADALEKKRINILKKICYLIAYDPRGQLLSFSQFKTIFEVYLKNVTNLLPVEIFNEINNKFEEFKEAAYEFQDIFNQASLRIQRNENILKTLIKHVNLSINLFHSEGESSFNYDSLGKSQNIFKQNNSISSIRVTV